MESLEGFSLSWSGFSAVLKVSCAGPLFRGLLGKAKLDALFSPGSPAGDIAETGCRSGRFLQGLSELF